MAERDIRTVTVIGSNTVARPDGRAAIVLETLQEGAIAFEVTLQTIPQLRQEIDAAERILRSPIGRA